MDSRDGGCTARYAGGGGGSDRRYELSKVDRIMLKFRPIAPKPVASCSGSGSGSGGSMRNNIYDKYVRSGRLKRKYNKRKKDTNDHKGCSKNTVSMERKISATSSPPSESVSGSGDAVVTLSLMPETPDRREQSSGSYYPIENSNLLKKCNDSYNHLKSSPIWLLQQTARDRHVVVTQPPSERWHVVSVVTVECVTETWMNGGCTDEERVINMEMDTCPGFISDVCGDRVVWINKAYREMAGGSEMLVVLARKDNRAAAVPQFYPAAFTCTVRVTCRSHGASSPPTLTAPCDVWRMECGGYAWRLDVKAALRLGR